MSATDGQNPTAEQELDVLGEIIGHKLQRDDVRKLLDQLSVSKRGQFTSTMAAILLRASALLHVSQRVSESLSVDVLLRRIAELVCEFLDTEKCTIFLYDKETDELFTRISLDAAMSEVRFPKDKGIAGHVFMTGEQVLIPDAYADPRFNPAIDRQTGYRTRNIVCVPVKHIRPEGVQIIGAAQVLNKRGGDFRREEVNQLEALTAQAASSLANALVHEEIERARQEERQLLDVTTAISTELNLQPLLIKIMATVRDMLDADRTTLFIHDPRTDELVSAVMSHSEVEEIRFPAHKGIAGAVFTTAGTISIPDAYQDARFNPEIDSVTGYRTRSVLCMPVINRKGDLIGVTQVLNKKGGPFTVSDQNRLRAFSAQASIAMENARLFDEVVQIKNYNESIVESMTNGVITVDRDARIEKVNSAALRLLHVEGQPERLVGQTANAVFTADNAWVLTALDEIRRTGEQQVAMDAQMVLPIGEHDADSTVQTVAMNLTGVALTDTKDQPIGALLLLEDLTKEKRLKSTMARYMAKEVADKLLEEGESALGGKMQKASVLFTDIRSFTTISERIGPQETVKMLNEYFTIMVDIILDHGGILDKYIGDAIMAVFGVPFGAADDADRSVKAAIKMLVALTDFNRQRESHGQEAVRMGLGINTDEVLSGNIGSMKRMDYTVIGDGVNLASRLESANKYYSSQILISQLTVDDLQGSYKLREVDRIKVKGKNQPIGVFEVLDYLDQTSDIAVAELIARFQLGIEKYRKLDWDGARREFEGALEVHPEDGPAQLYLERCDHFQANPPEPGWDGVWTMVSK